MLRLLHFIVHDFHGAKHNSLLLLQIFLVQDEMMSECELFRAAHADLDRMKGTRESDLVVSHENGIPKVVTSFP
ncbi:Hypothetical protein CINCED_3A003259 [Cinara cedri]|uniref:Uncharacterized protein n=1 Tax=Cinara cedri TaxID=506608 RepID=A0A5E4NLN0_9HEMI|nr:Hypothetical protein CINCED_3A003259 [Cinara cedri]